MIGEEYMKYVRGEVTHKPSSITTLDPAEQLQVWISHSHKFETNKHSLHANTIALEFQLTLDRCSIWEITLFAPEEDIDTFLKLVTSTPTFSNF